jgi:hypothetical protein
VRSAKDLFSLKCMKIHVSLEEEIRLLQIRFKKAMGTPLDVMTNLSIDIPLVRNKKSCLVFCYMVAIRLYNALF